MPRRWKLSAGEYSDCRQDRDLDRRQSATQFSRSASGYNEPDLLQWVASIERASEHPLANAIVKARRPEALAWSMCEGSIRLQEKASKAW